MKVSGKHLIVAGAIAFMAITAFMVHVAVTSVRNANITAMEKVQTTYTFIEANRAARYFGGVDVDAGQEGITPDSLNKLSQSAINAELKKKVSSVNKDFFETIQRAERLAATAPLEKAKNPDIVEWLLALQMSAFADLLTRDARAGFPSAPAALLFNPMWILGFLAAMVSCFAVGWGFGMRRIESKTAGA